MFRASLPFLPYFTPYYILICWIFNRFDYSI